jgi:uncharacterized protein YjbI with pentapeptide repeats
MAANDKSGFWNDWKAQHPRWHQLLVLELASITGLVVGFIWLRGADIWLFWSENRDNVRDLLFALAAPVALITAGAALRQASIAGKRHVEQTNADRERRITDSFTKAVELLGKPELEVRLGAIYALERIARESKRDHWPIMETLTAYVRIRLPIQHSGQELSKSDESRSSTNSADGTAEVKKGTGTRVLPVDIQAVLTVLSRRNAEHDAKGQLINLSRTDLRGANLRRVNLSRVNLDKADLSRADLSRTDLSGANLRQTNLNGASLNKADLSRASLMEAKLGGATLWRTKLNEADLNGAALNGADLSEAYLAKANLSETYLAKANLSGTNLSGANLAKIQSLDSAKFCQTIMPDGTVNNRDCPPEPAPPDPSETTPVPD